MRSVFVAAVALLACGAAQAQEATSPANPCEMSYEENALRFQAEAALAEQATRPILLDPLSNQPLTGCSVWSLEVSASGEVTEATYVRGEASGNYEYIARQYLERLRFLRFSAPWTATYLLRPRNPG